MEYVGEVVLKGVLEILFGRYVSPILQDFACREGLQEWMVDWKEKFSRVQAVLKDANEQQITRAEVKLWIDKFTDLAYDVEDILDELATEALQRKLIGDQSRASSSKVRNLVLPFFNSLTPSVDELKSTMRKKIEIITPLFDELMAQKDKLNLNPNIDGTANTRTKKDPSTFLESSNDQMFGRDEDADAVFSLLDNNDASTKLNVISIIGLGGIGKTRLAKFVYNHSKVESVFDLKAWVSVSEDFDVEAITKTILTFVNTEIKCEKMYLSQLQVELNKAIRGKRFLIVLDDVWNRNSSKWTLLCAPFEGMAPGSSIMITTRHQKVSEKLTAVNTRSHSSTHRLGSLSVEASLSLFAQYALQPTAHPKLEEICQKIVRKCNGLPLALKAVGSLLHNREAERNMWESVLNSKIWDTLEASDEDEVVPALMLTYHHLPSHLKRCFVYCSIFPKDYQFEKNQVVLLWMAEGLIQPKNNNEVEKLGRQYFDDLVSWSLFEESQMDKSRFLMHNLVNGLAQSVAGNTCIRVKDKVEDSEGGNISMKARHSSYLGGIYNRIENLDVFFSHTSLRTFLPLMLPYPGNCYLAPNVPHQLITRLRHLRVFSLKGYRITELSISIGNLKHLRYLNLSETLIRSIPESITTLYNLQTLLLEYCYHLNKLPSKFGNLVNLRHLNIQGAMQLEGMPMQIGKLVRLRTLSDLVVGKDNCSGIKELGSLPYLQGTLCISKLENVTEPKEAKDAKLISKPGITGLSLVWSGDIDVLKDRAGEFEILENLEPHESLKELTISGYGTDDFPTWLKSPSFPYMVYLKIENCKKCTSLPAIGQLSFLKVLYIGGMAKVTTVCSEFCGNDISQPFRSLETLHFHGMNEWENWSPCEEFPNLRELSLRRCPKISGNIPNHLPSLKKFKIYDCEQLRISVANFSDACEIDVDGSKGLVHSNSTVGFNSLEIRSLSKVSMFTSQLLGFDKQWMTRAKDLTISSCEETTHLWSDDRESLPDLPVLDILCIDRCPKLVSLVVGKREEEFGQDMPCPSTKIEINNCTALKSLPMSLMYNNSRLKLIRIVKCDSLVHIASGQLPPTLERIEISYCQDLKCLLMDADTCSCSNSTSQLECLIIQYCPSLESLTRSGRLPASLKHLDLFKCPKLVSIANRLHPDLSIECIKISDCELLESLPTNINTLSTLCEIDIRDCRNLGFSLDQDQWLPANLRVLYISGCEKMLALPKGIHNHTSLQNLTIQRCPNIVSFPKEGFPTSLKSLSISHLKIIDPLFKWGLNKLPSLNNLEIGGCPDSVSFPADHEMKLPESLTSLTISHFSNLRDLSSKGFQNLTSLEELFISECKKFKSFPKDGLPPSLLKLYIDKCEKLLSFPKNGLPPSLLELHIYQCPLLEKLCKKDGGKEWRTISHVPCVRFNSSY